jgi:hypothetical protein
MDNPRTLLATLEGNPPHAEHALQRRREIEKIPEMQRTQHRPKGDACLFAQDSLKNLKASDLVSTRIVLGKHGPMYFAMTGPRRSPAHCNALAQHWTHRTRQSVDERSFDHLHGTAGATLPWMHRTRQSVNEREASKMPK